jgi:altronate dehydratase small subunit
MEHRMSRAIVLNVADNVATLLEAGKAGSDCVLQGARTGSVRLIADVSLAHKIALADLRKGDQVIKYGEVIGRATTDIATGEHAHVHNIESLRGRGDLAVQG